MKSFSLSAREFEIPLWEEGFQRVMGLDEVGRGCLAGPVVAAGVIFRREAIPQGIYDSKKLSAARRASVAQQIKDAAVFWTVKCCEPQEIDKLNILWASMRAMEKCVEDAGARPDYLLVDGNRYLPTLIPHQCLVKGDSRCVSIAAASILAKEYRDAYMRTLDAAFPEFNWGKNVGYPTRDHYDSLLKYGITPHHRRSFKLRTDRLYAEV